MTMTTPRIAAFLALSALAALGSGCIVTTEPSGCRSSRDCPSGTFCDGRGVCVADTTCRSSAECPAGTFCDRGACVVEGCRGDLDCPAGAFCDRGECVVDVPCRGDLDCPSGSICDRGDCVVPVGIPVYDECVHVDECDLLADRCQEIITDWPDGVVSSGNICTLECLDSDDCPVSMAGRIPLCVSFSSLPFLCYESCVADVDCAAGFACGNVGDGFFICLPR